MKVELEYIQYAGPKQEALAVTAVQGIERAINHPEFKSVLLNRKWDNCVLRLPNGKFKRLTPEEGYEKLLTGAELFGAKDGVITIKCHLAKRSDVGGWSIGNDYFETAYWFINQQLSRGSYHGLAANFIHEWCHVAGFWHYPSNSARNDMPYNTGAAVEKILSKLDKTTNKKSLFANNHMRLECGAEGYQDSFSDFDLMH